MSKNLITDFFTKSKDYDPDLSFDKILKSWEENFLGSGQQNEHFSYPLESDISFDNPNLGNLTDDKLVLSMLFDQSLHPDQKEKFTCVNSVQMNRFIKNGCNDIKSKNHWIISRFCDALSKPFLRFVLKPNLSESDINNLLYLLADCEFKIEMGGSTMLNIPKLLFIFLICEKLSKPIKIFDVAKFLEENSMEQIRNMICKFTDKSCWINMKYYVEKKNSVYIDIPLLVDFFSYNMSTALVSLQYHEVRYLFNIPEQKVNMISRYIDGIVPMFEEFIYSDTNFRRQLTQTPMEFIKMNSTMDYFHCWTGNIIKISDYKQLCKFIFVIVRQAESTDLENNVINRIDMDVDVQQFPQILSVELTEFYNDGNWSETTKQSQVQLENIWVGQYDNIVVYGIASDGVSNMSNWIKVQSECIDSIEKLAFRDNNSNSYSTNLNTNNYEQIYRIVNLDEIKLTWSESLVPVNIEIICIDQNLQRIISGMTGDAFSR